MIRSEIRAAPASTRPREGRSLTLTHLSVRNACWFVGPNPTNGPAGGSLREAAAPPGPYRGVLASAAVCNLGARTAESWRVSARFARERGCFCVAPPSMALVLLTSSVGASLQGGTL